MVLLETIATFLLDFWNTSTGEEKVSFVYFLPIIQSSRWAPVLRPKTSKTLFRPVIFQLLFRYITGTCFIQKIMPPTLPYIKENICPFPLPHFASIFFAYLWSFRWPNYIATLPRYLSFRLPHLNIPTGPPSDELDKNIQWTSLGLLFSHWNGYSHFRFVLNFSYAFVFSRPAMCNNAIMIISSQM